MDITVLETGRVAGLLLMAAALGAADCRPTSATKPDGPSEPRANEMKGRRGVEPKINRQCDFSQAEDGGHRQEAGRFFDDLPATRAHHRSFFSGASSSERRASTSLRRTSRASGTSVFPSTFGGSSRRAR